MSHDSVQHATMVLFCFKTVDSSSCFSISAPLRLVLIIVEEGYGIEGS